MNRCPRCNCEATGQNRLVIDSCGHNKCRLCLLADVSDCFECKAAIQISTPGIEKDPPQQQEENVQASDTRSNINHIIATAEGFHCKVCNKTFRSRTQQYYHRACGNEMLKKFPCTQCSRRFATRSHLKYHQNSHGSNPSFSCNICEKSFTQEIVMRHHIKRVHEDVAYPCQHCQRKFATQGALRTHELVHSGDSLPYKCDSCDKCYLTKANLKQHQLKHDQNSVRHSCSFCNKSFLRRSILKLHLKRHTTRLRHTCSHCQKSLNDADALARHIKQHTATHRYRCLQCEVTVNRRDNMIRHLRSMHQGVQFSTGVEVIEEQEKLVSEAPAEFTEQIVRYNSVIKSVGNVEPVILPTLKPEAEQDPIAVVSPATSLPDKMQKENVKLYRKIILDLDNEEYTELSSSGLDMNLGVAETCDEQQVTLQQPQLRVPGHVSSNFSERHWRKNYKNFYENEHTISPKDK